MQTKRFFQVLIAILLFSSSAFAQTYIGKIVDSKKEGIGFAHVFFQNDQSRGSISNDIGGFSIFVTEENQTDTLVISVLGYETKFIPFDKIEKYNNVIELISSIMELDEITVTSDSYFRYVIKEAIAKIPNNYPTETHLLKGYYQNYTITDSVYSEMIEADFQLLSNGYVDAKLKERIYLNQLRKTLDKRNLPKNLSNGINNIYHTLDMNNVYQRKLSRYSRNKNLKSMEEFISSVDGIRSLTFHSQSIQEGDTILTIRISDHPSFLKIQPIGEDKPSMLAFESFVYLSINLTDKAIVKMVFKVPGQKEREFEELVYRKIEGIYYPSYIRSGYGLEFDQLTREFYTSKSILFYDIVIGKQNLKGVKNGKKFREENILRDTKMKLDNSFWENYPHAYQLPVTSVLRTKFSIFK